MPKKVLNIEWYQPYYGTGWNDLPMPFLDASQVPNEGSSSAFALFPQERRLMTPDDLAVFLGIETKTVYNWVCAKKIEYIKVGKGVRFTRCQIDRYLKEHLSKAI